MQEAGSEHQSPGALTPGVGAGSDARNRAVIGVMVAACLAIHIVTDGQYGYFRDELYYIACSNHLAWGYVDQPPLIAFVTWASRLLLGESLHALRLIPALAHAGLIILTAKIAAEFGGKAFAQFLAALAVLMAPIYLGLGYIMTMNAFESLIWMGGALSVILAVKRQDARYWLLFGILAGIGLENKYSILVFGFSIAVGLALTPARRFLSNHWIWIGALAALIIFLPNLLWNIKHHFPFVELMKNIRASGRDIKLGPGQFIWQQILLIGPLAAPVWLAGLWFLFSRRGSPYRILGWAYVTALATFMLLHGKNYYLAPIYPMLLAGGSVCFEQWFTKRGLGLLRPASTALLLATGAALAPLVIPILPIDTFLRYQDVLPIKAPKSEKGHLGARLPQLYADQFGWVEMTAAVADVYNSLPAEERARTAIFAGNYGEAGAIDFFGPRYGLPKSICAHQNYFFWGPRGYDGRTMIVLGDRPENLKKWFQQVDVQRELDNPYAIPFENRPVALCRGLKGNLSDLWPELKIWD